jgi:hypothetical protein
MNDKSQVKSDSDWVRYLKETGNYDGYDGMCGCYSCKRIADGFDSWKAKHTEPEPATITIPLHEYTTLKSQLTQVQAEAEGYRKRCIDGEWEITDLTVKLTQAHKERDEAVACVAVMREALEKVSKWLVNNTDIIEENPLLDDVVSPALSTNCGKALVERMKEAEKLLRETKPRQRYDKNWDEWKARRDAFLKGAT